MRSTYYANCMSFPAFRQELGRAAGMDKFDVETRVVLPEDQSFRVNVSLGVDPEHGDQVAVLVADEPGRPGMPWRVAHFSPARARLLGAWLMEMADRAEGH